MAESKNQQLRNRAEMLPYLPDMQFRIGSFSKLFKAAKKFYKKDWRHSETSSPAFGDRIVRVTNMGWRHIVGKTVTTNHKDAIKRLNHLPNAKQIIEKAKSIYETVEETDKRGKIVHRHSLLGKLEDGTVLRVVVKEEDDRLLFVTVYDPLKVKKMDSKETQARKPE